MNAEVLLINSAQLLKLLTYMLPQFTKAFWDDSTASTVLSPITRFFDAHLKKGLQWPLPNGQALSPHQVRPGGSSRNGGPVRAPILTHHSDSSPSLTRRPRSSGFTHSPPLTLSVIKQLPHLHAFHLSCNPNSAFFSSAYSSPQSLQENSLLSPGFLHPLSLNIQITNQSYFLPQTLH